MGGNCLYTGESYIQMQGISDTGYELDLYCVLYLPYFFICIPTVKQDTVHMDGRTHILTHKHIITLCAHVQ